MRRRVCLVRVAGVAFLGVSALTAAPLQAATITVNSTVDVINPNDRRCTLREAIIAANTNVASGLGPGECPAGDPGGDLIVFQDPPGSPDVFLLDGNTLYVVQNANRIAVVALSPDHSSGTITRYITEPFASNLRSRLPSLA